MEQNLISHCLIPKLGTLEDQSHAIDVEISE